MHQSLKESLKIINEIEKIYFSKFKYEKINYWPIVKLVLWQNFTNDKKIKIFSKYKNIFFKVIKWLSFNIKNYLFSDDYYGNTIFFFGVPTSIVNLREDNKKYDRIFDPIIEKLSKKNYKKIYFNNSFVSNSRMAYRIGGIRSYFNLNLFEYNAPISLEIFLYKICKYKRLDQEKILFEFRKEFSNFTGWYLYTKKFLKKYNKLKEVFFYPWYASNSMGIILALKEKGIKTIDIQHGEQGNYQAMYTHWKKTPKKGFELLPDYFYCWNKKTIIRHYKYSDANFKKKHKSILFKENWSTFYAKFRKLKRNTSDTCILFCLQPYNEIVDGRLIPTFFIKFMNSKKAKNIKVIIRIHPNDKKILFKLKKIIKTLEFKDSVTIDTGRFSLYDTFSNVTHCFSKSSTASIEAANYGLKSAFFGINAKEKYSYLYKNVYFLDNKKNTFNKWVFNT